MTREEAKSCIGTIELLQRLAYNIHGVMDVIDAGNCKKIIEALKKEPRWILVTERLPEEGYSVLVMRITDEYYKYMRVATYQGDCWMDDTDKFNKPNPHKVIAWMPLPQPYKAESEASE